MIREIAVAPAPWYKAVLKEDLLDLKSGTNVWFKLNTERPLQMGPTYWIFDPLDKKLRHIAEDLGDETLKGIRENSGWSIATNAQTTELNKRFLPLVNALMKTPAWSKAGKLDSQGKDFKLGYKRDFSKSPKPKP